MRKFRVPSILFPNGIDVSAWKFGVSLMFFLNGIGACREIRGSLDALPEWNWCKCREIRGSLEPLPEHNWCKCGEIWGSHACPDGIRARSTRSPSIYVQMKFVPSLGDSRSPDICPDGIRVSLGDSRSPLYPLCKRGRFAPPKDGEHVCGHHSSVEIWGSQIAIQMEFVQVWEFQGSSLIKNSYKCGRDIHGPPTCPDEVQNSGLTGPHLEETHAWTIRGLVT